MMFASYTVKSKPIFIAGNPPIVFTYESWVS